MTTTIKRLAAQTLLGGIALLLCAAQAYAVAGVWRRTARRTTAVVATTAVVTSSAAASQQAASQQTAAAQQSAAEAEAAAAAAQQAAAASQQAAAPAQKTPQQKLQELQSLYKQGLISEAEYQAAKSKILAEM